MLSSNEKNDLSNSWTLWYHSNKDNDWSINSYKKIYSFDTLEDCIRIIENIENVLVEKSMLFLMKDNIKPLWEVEENNKGGSISYKISIENIYNVWKKLIYHLIGNTLCDEYIIENINGISVSPKKNFCIIKIWMGNIININESIIYDYFKKTDIELDDPFNINELCNIEKHIPLFKLHETLKYY